MQTYFKKEAIMKRYLLVFVLACCLLGRQAFASDQKLVHGAGTLPHLTSAFTLSLGAEIPTPLYYALRYDIGLGNRVQLGLSGSMIPIGITAVQIHSTFNVLKSADDRDFLSLYLNPGFINISGFLSELLDINWNIFLLEPGVAYEHRFGDRRRIGLYAKVGATMGVGGTFDGESVWGLVLVGIDFRVGFQALPGKHFSITLEPYFQTPEVPGGKAALTWAL